MQNFSITIFQAGDEAAVIDLWRRCGLVVPWNHPGADIERKLADSPDLFFIGKLDREIIASCMAGYDGHRGWIYFLAVDPARGRKGFGSKLVAHAEARLRDIGCPKIDLMVRKANDGVISFYERLGYATDPVVVMSKRLIADKKHDHG